MDEFKYFNIKFDFCYNFNIHFLILSKLSFKIYPKCPSKLSFIKIVEGNRKWHYALRFNY